MFYPAQPEMVFTVLRVLLGLNIPFVLVHRAESPPLPTALRESIEASPLVFLTQWAPQQYTLSHPATGWFLSHCGLNSVQESLASGIPLICWPLFADQPLLSIMVSQVLNCGFELSEVRQGFGLKYRQSTGMTPTGTLEAVAEEAREVLKAAFFDQEKRAVKEEGARKMQKLLNDAWKESGEAKKDAEAFVQFVLA